MSVRLSQDVLKKIRQVEISARRLLQGSLIGDSRSAVKGSGFEFDQIREYQLGDDIRCIDWNGSARSNKLLVKQYIEERTQTIMLVVDVSASSMFSSTHHKRLDVMAQIAAVLALVSNYAKDSVGLILFSDTVELCLPPGRGQAHVRMIMEKLYTHSSQGKRTRIAGALDRLVQMNVRDGIALVISDFIDQEPFERALRGASKKYDLVAVRCLDSNEQVLPNIGFVTIEDSETEQISMLDLRSRQSQAVQKFLHDRAHDQVKLFKKYGVECIDVALNRPFMPDIIRFFRKRMMY